MNEVKPKRPLYWWRMWPILGFGVLIAWEIVAAQTDGRAIDWVWVGIAIAAIVVVVFLRVFMRV